MGLYGKGKNYHVGSSRAMKLPPGIKIEEESSYAGNRILITDPRGEIDSDSLLAFFEEYVEPEFWRWYRKWKEVRGQEQDAKEGRQINRTGRTNL